MSSYGGAYQFTIPDSTPSSYSFSFLAILIVLQTDRRKQIEGKKLNLSQSGPCEITIMFGEVDAEPLQISLHRRCAV